MPPRFGAAVSGRRQGLIGPAPAQGRQGIAID